MVVPGATNPLRAGNLNPGRFENRAEKMMESLLDKGPDYYEKLQKSVEKQEQVSRSPISESTRKLWVSRFKMFLEKIVKIGPDSVPDEKTIAMFIRAMADVVRGKCGPGKDVLSLHTLQSAVAIIRDYYIFHHPDDFQMKKGCSKRIESLLQQLVKEGYLTRDPSRQKQLWITSHLIKKMNVAILASALRDGTPSWEVTIFYVLCLALQSALCARAGDIVRSDGYIGMEALCWKDVNLVLNKPDGRPLPEEHSSPLFTATFTLRYRKDEKDDSSRNFAVPIEELTSPSENAICPIKLLLVHGLRTNAVEEKSLADLIRRCELSKSRKVVAKHPDRPVLSHPGGHGSYLELDKPASVRDVQRALNIGSRLVGLLDPPRTHDIRYGAAIETDRIAEHARGGGTGIAVVQSVLGHGEGSRQNGVSKKYIGHRAPSGVWPARRAASPVPEVEREMNLAPSGARPKMPKATSEEITRICEELGFDPTIRNSRYKAGQFRTKRWIADWRAKQMELLDMVPPRDDDGEVGTNGDPDAMDLGSVGPGDQQCDPHTSIPHGHHIDDGDDVMDLDNVNPGGQGCDSDTSTSHVEDDADDNDLSIPGAGLYDDDGDADESELAKFHEISESLFGPSSSTLAESLVIDMDTPMPGTGDDEACLPKDRSSFIDRFSKENLRKLTRWRVGERWDKGDYGGSAGPPVEDKRRSLECPNKKHGCTMKFLTSYPLKRHLSGPQGCKFASAGALPHRCQEEGCRSAFETEEKLANHVSQAHTVGEFTCTAAGCTSTEVFPTKARLHAHRVFAHTAEFKDLPCPVPGCKMTGMLVSTHALRRHLNSAHRDLPREEKMGYVPVNDPFLNANPKVRFFKAQMCSFPGCKSQAVYPYFSLYLKHAQGQHAITDRQGMLPHVLGLPLISSIYIESVNFKPQPCLIPGCDSTTLWKEFGVYLQHAQAKHGVKAPEELTHFILKPTLATSESTWEGR